MEGWASLATTSSALSLENRKCSGSLEKDSSVLLLISEELYCRSGGMGCFADLVCASGEQLSTRMVEDRGWSKPWWGGFGSRGFACRSNVWILSGSERGIWKRLDPANAEGGIFPWSCGNPKSWIFLRQYYSLLWTALNTSIRHSQHSLFTLVITFNHSFL